jgi:hypothetical protein
MNGSPALSVFRAGIERNHLTRTAPRLVGGEPQRVRAAQHLLGGLPNRLADLGDDQFGKRRHVPLHKGGAGVEHTGPRVPGQGAAGACAFAGSAQEGLCVLRRHVRNGADLGAVEGVGHRDAARGVSQVFGHAHR